MVKILRRLMIIHLPPVEFTTKVALDQFDTGLILYARRDVGPCCIVFQTGKDRRIGWNVPPPVRERDR
jgi:hypothetical protein